MNGVASPVEIVAVQVRDQRVLALLDELTQELAAAGYAPEETFGYSADKLEQAGVHLVGALVDGQLVGVGGLEVEPAQVGELKRFYVTPLWRGSGVADALLRAVVDHAVVQGVKVLRLETGDKQKLPSPSTAGTASRSSRASGRTSTAPPRCACSGSCARRMKAAGTATRVIRLL